MLTLCVQLTYLLQIYVSAVNGNGSVDFTLEARSANISMTRTILPGEVNIVTDLPADLRHEGSGIDNKAIRIFAEADIVVYGVNKQTFSTDAFLAFPADVVGSEYYSAHYYPGESVLTQT